MDGALPKGVQPQRGAMPDEELCLMCLMHRVWGRAQAPTAGLQHAPSGSVDAVERVMRGLRIEGLAAASASTFFSRELVAA